MSVKAKESRQIQKAREKLKEHMKASDKLMNPEALSAMSRLIKEQLNRQRPGRITLKKRQITREEGEGYARPESKFVQRLINQIKKETASKNELEGRITPLPDIKP